MVSILQRPPGAGRITAVAGVRRSPSMGVKKTGKGRRKLGQKKRRMRARIRHRKR